MTDPVQPVMPCGKKPSGKRSGPSGGGGPRESRGTGMTRLAVSITREDQG